MNIESFSTYRSMNKKERNRFPPASPSLEPLGGAIYLTVVVVVLSVHLLVIGSITEERKKIEEKNCNIRKSRA